VAVSWIVSVSKRSVLKASAVCVLWATDWVASWRTRAANAVAVTVPLTLRTTAPPAPSSTVMTGTLPETPDLKARRPVMTNSSTIPTVVSIRRVLKPIST
jgi:hypothetical protein